jgi:molybdopterin-guanine dinucleotide biosynthesis protein A
MKFLADKKIQTAALPNEWIALANFNTKNEFDLALNSLNDIG